MKNLSAFWLPEFTLQKEIGSTVYTVTGSYDGVETLDKKMERIMGVKSLQKRWRILNDKYAMTNTQSLGTIEATNSVLVVSPLKEETEMLRATDKITALYCRLSVEDLKEDKKAAKRMNPTVSRIKS